jgi:hypothetical protein
MAPDGEAAQVRTQPQHLGTDQEGKQTAASRHAIWYGSVEWRVRVCKMMQQMTPAASVEVAHSTEMAPAEVQVCAKPQMLGTHPDQGR